MQHEIESDSTLSLLQQRMVVQIAMCRPLAGSLTQIYYGATALQPLAPKPDKAFMTATPFSAHEADQPEAESFLLRMSGSFYHPGGASKLFILSAPPNAVAAIFIDGAQLATGDFDLPEGNHFLDVRCGLSACWTWAFPTMLRQRRQPVSGRPGCCCCMRATQLLLVCVCACVSQLASSRRLRLQAADAGCHNHPSHGGRGAHRQQFCGHLDASPDHQ